MPRLSVTKKESFTKNPPGEVKFFLECRIIRGWPASRMTCTRQRCSLASEIFAFRLARYMVCPCKVGRLFSNATARGESRGKLLLPVSPEGKLPDRHAAALPARPPSGAAAGRRQTSCPRLPAAVALRCWRGLPPPPAPPSCTADGRHGSSYWRGHRPPPAPPSGVADGRRRTACGRLRPCCGPPPPSASSYSSVGQGRRSRLDKLPAALSAPPLASSRSSVSSGGRLRSNKLPAVVNNLLAALSGPPPASSCS